MISLLTLTEIFFMRTLPAWGGVVLGCFCPRLRGVYLAMLTLALRASPICDTFMAISLPTASIAT